MRSKWIGKDNIAQDDFEVFIFLLCYLIVSSGQLLIPSGIRMLSVEQEVDGDETTVLDSVLSCDTQRQTLLRREQEINDALSGYVFCFYYCS